MSYIRSPYNPEALYIWGEGNNRCRFMKGSEIVGTMPTDIFNGLIKAYVKEDVCLSDGHVEYKEARVEEVWVNIKGEKVDEDDVKPEKNELRTRLSYKDWHIDMWDVTWYYIAHSNYFRFKQRILIRLLKIFQ